MATYEFHFLRGVRTRKYAGVEKIEMNSTAINPSSWLRAAIKTSAEHSVRVPGVRTVRNISKAIEFLTRNKSAEQLLNKTLAEITERDLEKLFEILEIEIAKDFQDRSAARISLEFRSLVIVSLRRVSTTISIHQLRFRTRFRWEGSGRKLISDLPSHEGAPERRLPIGSIGGSTYEEMRAAHTKVLETDLDSIKAAAIADLNYFRQLREQVRALSVESVDLETENFLKKTCRSPKISEWRRKRLEELISQRPTTVLSTCAKIVYEHRYINAQHQSFFRITGAAKKGLSGYQDKYYIRLLPLLSLPFRACTIEILSAFVLILTYTGWNSSSLCGMHIYGIMESEDGTITLQGYKSKTDDDTPTYVFDRRQTELAYAVDLIRWNRTQLIELGFLEKQQHQLWFAWTIHYGVMNQQAISFQDFLKKFQERHHLPTFTFDQIRTQVLALVYAKSGSHELTRHMAGHANLYSLGHYINQLLLLRLASASNLEFMKRLENNVYFDISPNRIYDQAGSSAQLTPIGDGTTCADPWHPPIDELLEGEICNGKACHVGEGCKNRRLIITPERLEELVRKRTYFQRNWQRLLGENPDRFRLYTFPSMLFVERLCNFIEPSIYGKLLKEMTVAIQQEMVEN